MAATNTFAPLGGTILPANDDESSSYIDITSVFEGGINFFGKHFNEIYVNNNGNVTFSKDLYTYTPSDIGGSSNLAIIAPFWADVDTRGAGSQVSYSLNRERDSFIVTWSNVDYYDATASNHISKFNSFQLELTDQGGGNFNIIFRYGGLSWTTGDASSGANGLGGHVARAGFASGDGEHYFELPQSGSESGMLGLTSALGSMNNPGVWEFEVRSGEVQGIGSERNDSLLGNAGDNFIDGRSGNDRIEAGEGNDRVLGGSGDDTLIAGHGQGNDSYDGGADIDTITFTSTKSGVKISLADGTASGAETNSDLIMGVEHVIAGYGNDTIVGDVVSNRLSGLSGKDTIRGELGDDELLGGLGQDTLWGQAGKDKFVFDDRDTGASKAKADFIADFSGLRGDRIDLQAMDAITKKSGDQKFSFIGTKAFSKAGEVRYEKAKGSTYVYLNTDSDKAAEAVIKLKGAMNLHKSWFLL